VLLFSFTCFVPVQALFNFNFFFFFLTGKHWFSTSSSDWGYSQFMPLTDLLDPCQGFLVNDTLIVEVEIIVISNVK
jgi:hypothetical protein